MSFWFIWLNFYFSRVNLIHNCTMAYCVCLCMGVILCVCVCVQISKCSWAIQFLNLLLIFSIFWTVCCCHCVTQKAHYSKGLSNTKEFQIDTLNYEIFDSTYFELVFFGHLMAVNPLRLLSHSSIIYYKIG